MHYKPGKTNILADALSRRPDYDLLSALSRQEVDDDEDDDRCATCVSLNLTRVSPESCLLGEVVATYTSDPDYVDIIAYLRAPSDAALGATSRTKSSDILWTETCSYTASINLTPLALLLSTAWTCAIE